MVNLEDFQISSPGPMVGFSFGEQIFENGYSIGLLFADVSAKTAKAFWKECGREDDDWLEYRRDLDDRTTSVIMNSQLGELFPLWDHPLKHEVALSPIEIPGSRLIRESWDLAISEDMIRLHYEREYQPLPELATVSKESIVKRNHWRWSWSAFREIIRIGIDLAKMWVTNSGG